MRQFQNIPPLNATGNEENILKFSLTKYHVHCLCLFETSETANLY